MGVWNTATPAGSDTVDGGDDRIREMKVALEEALSAGKNQFPGSAPLTAPVFHPGFNVDTTGNRPTGDALFDGRLYFNTTLNVAEVYNGSSWAAVATLIPPGTKMLFYQASVPVGWTAVVLNDRFLRLVNGGGSGGTTGGSGLVPSDTTAFSHTHTVDGHTHTIAHTHTVEVHPNSTTGSLLIEGGSPLVQRITAAGGGALAWGDQASSSANQRYKVETTSASSAANSGSTGPGTGAGLASLGFQYADFVTGTKD